LKLPFNVTENPYTAAQKFLDQYELPQGYLDQVADFITKNARAVSQGEVASAGDPFTGNEAFKGPSPKQTWKQTDRHLFSHLQVDPVTLLVSRRLLMDQWAR